MSFGASIVRVGVVTVLRIVLAAVDLAVTAKVGDHGELATTAFDITSERCCLSVMEH